jgi:hypothetical protein
MNGIFLFLTAINNILHYSSLSLKLNLKSLCCEKQVYF